MFVDEKRAAVYTLGIMATKAAKPPIKRRKAVRKDQSVLVRLTAEQKETLTAAAAKVGLGLSTWLLSTALKAAQQ